MTHLSDAAFDAPMPLTDVQVFLFGDKLLLGSSKELRLIAFESCQIVIATIHNQLTSFFAC